MTLLFYHAFVYLEIEGDRAIVTEKHTDSLEIMFGERELMEDLAMRERAVGDEQPTRIRYRNPKHQVLVRHLANWMAGPLAAVWKPYCVLTSNCQHYAADLLAFLRDPEDAMKVFGSDHDLLLAAVQRDGLALRYASDKLKDDKDIVLAAVKNNGLALRFASDCLKDTLVVARAAVENNGMALIYASDQLRDDFYAALIAEEHKSKIAALIAEKDTSDKYASLPEAKRALRKLSELSGFYCEGSKFS
jgi:hypothetical protein